MVLFRHLSLRERWARHRPSRGDLLLIALVFIACALLLDYLTGRVAHRAVVEARRELATVACVERLARAGDPGASRQKLRSVCASRLREAP